MLQQSYDWYSIFSNRFLTYNSEVDQAQIWYSKYIFFKLDIEQSPVYFSIQLIALNFT